MQNKIINLPGYGKVKCGKITTAKDCSVEVENYFGIPFARPPVGKLRFMPPQRAEPWPGVLSNQRPYKIPVQNNGFGKLAAIFRPTKDMFQDKHFSEDCLYLNVYVPKHVSSKKLPVMVWFYGGSFQTGPNMYMDGTALAAMNEVIVVVPNYRVGLLGFFSLGHQTDCKGNMGLLDQLESLRWVRENIEYFGGDRNNVTIFGESAGGISVNMHMKSQLSVGYFHKAISHSGVAVLPMIYYPSQQRMVNLFLEKLKIKEREPKKVLKLLQGLTVDVLFDTGDLQFGWYPTFDDYFFKKEPDLAPPVCSVPYLNGCNSNEGSWLMLLGVPNFTSGFSKQEFMRYASAVLRKYNKKIDLKKVLPLLLEKYGSGFNEKDKLFYSIIYGKIFADCVFTNGIIRTTQAYADAGEQVYFYYMTHQPLLNHDSRFGIETAKKPDYIDADHADDIYFTFGLPFLPQNLKNGFRFSHGEEEMSKKMMTYFTNFAKSGNPNMPVKLELEWPLYDSKSKQHIEFKTPTLGLGENLGKDSMHLYNNEISKL